MHIFLFILVGTCFGVEIHKSILGSKIRELIWCGSSIVYTSDDEAVVQQQQISRKAAFALTDEGRVFRSINWGKSWIEIADEDQFQKIYAGIISDFYEIQISPSDSRVLYFFSQSGQSIRTKDCGFNYQAISHDKNFYEFKLNKMSTEWLMAIKDIDCDEENNIQCQKTFKRSLFISKDGGWTWTEQLKYVRFASWDKLLQKEEVPDERIIACYLNECINHQQNVFLEGQSIISFSDDYFQNSKQLYENASGYFQTTNYLFLLINKDEGFQLVFSDANLENFNPQEIELPLEQTEHTFTILDTSKGQVYLSVSHNQENQKITQIYVSDKNGKEYSLSLLNNVRSLYNGNCDFEKLLGMDGAYIANVYDHQQVEQLRGRESVDTQKLEQYKRSYITLNRGKQWHSVLVPEYDSEDKEIHCSGDCSLQLKGRTDSERHAIYSSESAPGVAIAIGNVGFYLSQNDHHMNTYITRDGGITWNEIRKGPYISEIGESGGLIVLAYDGGVTDKILYSYDYGKSFHEIALNDTLYITSIITEPSNSEQRFIVYGSSSRVSDDPKDDGYIFSLDFTKLHDRECWGSWDPTMPESDFDVWAPEFLEQEECLLGKRIKYVRRKIDAQCYIKKLPKQTLEEKCQCSIEDYECDVGYEKIIEGGKCEPINQTLVENCQGTYLQSQGYKKLPGDVCVGGLDLLPQEKTCPIDLLIDEPQELQDQKKFIYFLIMLSLSIIIICLVKWRRKQISEIKPQTFTYEELGFVQGGNNIEEDDI